MPNTSPNKTLLRSGCLLFIANFLSTDWIHSVQPTRWNTNFLWAESKSSMKSLVLYITSTEHSPLNYLYGFLIMRMAMCLYIGSRTVLILHSVGTHCVFVRYSVVIVRSYRCLLCVFFRFWDIRWISVCLFLSVCLSVSVSISVSVSQSVCLSYLIFPSLMYKISLTHSSFMPICI